MIDTLRDTRQGQYRLDESRSAFYLERTKNFPKNSEVEATLTFVTDAVARPARAPGDADGAGRDGAAASLVHRAAEARCELAPNGYRPRKLDPRVGAFGIEFH